MTLRSSKGKHNIFEVLVTKTILELITYGAEEKDLQHLRARSTRNFGAEWSKHKVYFHLLRSFQVLANQGQP